MKNIAIINNGDNGSTGRIAINLYSELKQRGYNALFCYGRGAKSHDDYYRIDSRFSLIIHVLLTRITGLQGFYSNFATSKLFKKFKKNNIDTIYIVCIHGYYLNERRLYNFAAKNNIAIVHIMIDEYPFLGKCAYSNGCERYLSGCGHCPNKTEYPSSLLIDGSSTVFKMKQKVYERLNRAIFVGPEYVVIRAKQSPLFKSLKTEILDEAIDMDIYYPRNTHNLRKKLGIDDDKVVIGCVAPYRGEDNDRKGCRYFIELAKLFKNDKRYVFVHVGYMCKDTISLPPNYIAVGFLSDQNLLAEYFSLPDLFVFPSLLDTMPNACLNSLACGTPLLCFNVSGMPYLANDDIATMVEPKNVIALQNMVLRTSKKDDYIIKKCRDYALSRYDSKKYNDKLINIAKNI